MESPDLQFEDYDVEGYTFAILWKKADLMHTRYSTLTEPSKIGEIRCQTGLPTRMYNDTYQMID